MIKILLVDGDAVIRQGLHMLLDLRRNISLVGEAADGATALALVQALDPDVVVMEVMLPGVNGGAVAEKMRELAPRSAVVMLSLSDDAVTRERARAAGAKAFVGKYETPRVLLEAIAQAAGRAAEPLEGGEP
jgi:DNA-binding NarL/FixJ family response regulator